MLISTRGDAALEATITLTSDFAPGTMRVVSTSSGDQDYAANDHWIVIDDGDGVGLSALTFVTSHPTGDVQPHAVQLSDSQHSWSIAVELDPGEAASILHFAAQSRTSADAVDKAERFLSLGSETIDGIRQPRARRIVNFDIAGLSFRRGDARVDGGVDITDAIVILEHLFFTGRELFCVDAADANDDGIVNLSDSVGILGYLFNGTAAPPPPGAGACGRDLTADDLEACRYDPTLCGE